MCIYACYEGRTRTHIPMENFREFIYFSIYFVPLYLPCCFVLRLVHSLNVFSYLFPV